MLRARPKANVTIVENQIANKASGSVLHKDSNSGGGVLTGLRHVELDVLERSGLSYLPVNSSWIVFLTALVIRVRHVGHVDHKIPDLAIELILVDVPFVTISFRYIWISVDDCDTFEVARALEYGALIGVANELRIVVSACEPGSANVECREGPQAVLHNGRRY